MCIRDSSRIASRSGAATSRNAVCGSCRIRYVWSARCRKPPNIESSAATKPDRSVSNWAPRIFCTARENSPNDAVTRLNMLRPPRAGASSMRSIRPSRNRDSRAGASRKSSAERDGGVSTMIRSHSSPARNWPSFSIAMYSCVPAKVELMA